MTVLRWEKIIYLAVGLVILGSILFFAGFLVENRFYIYPISTPLTGSGLFPLRHVGFASTALGNFLLILHILAVVSHKSEVGAPALLEIEDSGELIYGFRFTFILLLVIGVVSAFLLGRAIFSPTGNLLLWLMGLGFPLLTRLVMLPLKNRLPDGNLKAVLKALLVVCWGLLLFQVLIGLMVSFPPPLSNVVLSGLLIGLGIVGLWVLHR
ncbi:hypothetical protein ACFLT7_04920 [candidate division KSB1 bacterium]